jgi:hypothetical protein
MSLKIYSIFIEKNLFYLKMKIIPTHLKFQQLVKMNKSKKKKINIKIIKLKMMMKAKLKIKWKLNNLPLNKN